ncbi:unnamed protein product [Ectocarpus sp. CCAP 1310/34]|nr:unnamed protein product [Ectocarpus sp. CCAP 1310/34]
MIDVWESEECERAMAVLGPGKTPFNVGNAQKVVDINTFHNRAGHLSEPILRLSAKQHGITLTGTMDSCRWCLPARGTRASVPKQGGGYRGKRAPNDVFLIDLCGAYTATIGGHHYMLLGVDAATGGMVCYAMRRKSEALAVVKRMVVDAAHKAGTVIKCIRMGIALEYSPPGVQQYNGVIESAIQRCLKVAKASRRAAKELLGPAGFSRFRELSVRGDELWAESAEDAAQKLNQSASPSNPGGASPQPQELYTGKGGPFRLIPFFQYGSMWERPATKMDDRAVPCFFLYAGDNHADVTVKVLKERTGHVCYTSNVAWAAIPPSGVCVCNASPTPSAGTLPTPQHLPFEIVASPPPAATAAGPSLPPPPSGPALWPAPSPGADDPPLPRPSASSTSAVPPPPAAATAAGPSLPPPPSGPALWPAPSPGAAAPPLPRPPAPSTSVAPPPPAAAAAAGPSPSPPPPGSAPLSPSPPLPDWSSSSIEAEQSPPQPHQDRRTTQSATAPGYAPLTPHASRLLGEGGDPRIRGRTRAEARTIAQQQLSALSVDRQLPSLQDDAVTTPLLPTEITMGLLAQANEDVLLSMLDARRVMNGKTMLRSGLKGGSEKGDRGEQLARSEGVVGSTGKLPEVDIGEEGRMGNGWSIGPSERGVPLGLVARLATRDDLDSAVRETEPPLLRPDMPRCHAKDLRVPQTFK